jgi:hypothetical protein
MNGGLINIKYYVEYSRYEYVLVSNALKLLILGNKQGDISIYNLEFVVSNDKLVFNHNPIVIIDMDTRLAGIRLHEVIDESNSNKNYCYLYIITIGGTLECYKLKK